VATFHPSFLVFLKKLVEMLSLNLRAQRQTFEVYTMFRYLSSAIRAPSCYDHKVSQDFPSVRNDLFLMFVHSFFSILWCITIILILRFQNYYVWFVGRSSASRCKRSANENGRRVRVALPPTSDGFKQVCSPDVNE